MLGKLEPILKESDNVGNISYYFCTNPLPKFIAFINIAYKYKSTYNS